MGAEYKSWTNTTGQCPLCCVSTAAHSAAAPFIEPTLLRVYNAHHLAVRACLFAVVDSFDVSNTAAAMFVSQHIIFGVIISVDRLSLLKPENTRLRCRLYFFTHTRASLMHAKIGSLCLYAHAVSTREKPTGTGRRRTPAEFSRNLA